MRLLSRQSTSSVCLSFLEGTPSTTQATGAQPYKGSPISCALLRIGSSAVASQQLFLIRFLRSRGDVPTSTARIMLKIVMICLSVASHPDYNISSVQFDPFCKSLPFQAPSNIPEGMSTDDNISLHLKDVRTPSGETTNTLSKGEYSLKLRTLPQTANTSQTANTLSNCAS